MFQSIRLGFFLLSVITFLGSVTAQDLDFSINSSEDPINWSTSVTKENDSTFILQLKAVIKKDWHLYSQTSPDGGSQPAIFNFEDNGKQYKLSGPTLESVTHSEYSDIFEVTEVFFKGVAVFTQKIILNNVGLEKISFSIDYQVCKDLCIASVERFSVFLDPEKASLTKSIDLSDSKDAQKTAALLLPLKNTERLGNELNETEGSKANNLWKIFILGVLGGLIALLTPCVFPMIPLTVSYFTKGSENRKQGISRALWYGFFIVFIYVLLSLPFHLFNSVDAQILNTVATNMWLNVFFFIVFVFFAGSFFGFYELNLPSSWANKMDASASKMGGIIGVFFMALTLALVSFSCTGPILGGLLGSTALASGDVATNLSVGMFGFGIALAFPFALFALFPGMLSSLPKSGGWMLTVKVFLGFLELGLAFKFLSNADLVGHWGLLKREVFLGIWMLLSLGLAAYLLGVFDKVKKSIHWSRFPWILGALVFGGFLLLGILKKQDLAWLSGFPPPSFYSLYEQESDCPLGLECYKDFEIGLSAAKAANKPILLDFTGWACVNCRRMEENVWRDPSVFNKIKNEFVLISLYIDDRSPLIESEQFIFQFASGRQKPITTVGQKWGTFQTVNFNAASQPYYVLLSPNLHILGPAIQYTNIDVYDSWLEAGLNEFKKQ